MGHRAHRRGHVADRRGHLGGAHGSLPGAAAIAAVHDEAPSHAATDRLRAVALCGLLLRMTDTPVVRMNHAVAAAMAEGPRAGLALLDGPAGLDGDHRFHAARAHLLEHLGRGEEARESHLTAAGLTRNVPQRRYLYARAGG